MTTQYFTIYLIISVLLSYVRLFEAPWTIACYDPLFMGFSRQEYWHGEPSLLQGIFPTQGQNQGLLHCRRILYGLSYQGSVLLDFHIAPFCCLFVWFICYQKYLLNESICILFFALTCMLSRLCVCEYSHKKKILLDQRPAFLASSLYLTHKQNSDIL